VDEPLDNQYFNWLCAKVQHVEVPTPSLTYWKLFRKLYSTEYVWLVSGDDNRAEDGLELREEFLTEARLPDEPGWRHGLCSVFEMLVAFSRRAEFNAGETPYFWFWHFLENLGLREANDASNISEEEIDEILYNFVWRGYDENGQGGICPMDFATNDQRRVEVWYQFCEYLVAIDWPI
jgi:hypothetical protein